MTEAEFLADLQSKVMWMGEPQIKSQAQGVVSKKLPIIELGQRGTVRPIGWLDYIVLNEGVTDNPDPFFNETAMPSRAIELPVNDALNAVAYLDSLVASGTFTAYEYDQGRADLGYFFAKVYELNQDGTESEHRIRVSYDAQGNPSHVKVV